MKEAYDFAKFFVKNGVDSTPNTYDGNMKLQKMLVLANMAHLAQFREPLFADDILAFENGPVVEKVRIRYKNDYNGLKADSERFNPDFSQEEYDTLNDVIGVYGGLTARDLSELTHYFKSWKQAYRNGTSITGYHDKKRSVVNFEVFPEDIELVGRAVNAYRETRRTSLKFEVINGVKFYYDDISITDAVLAELEKFSFVCDEDVYSVCKDDGRLVIY